MDQSQHQFWQPDSTPEESSQLGSNSGAPEDSDAQSGVLNQQSGDDGFFNDAVLDTSATAAYVLSAIANGPDVPNTLREALKRPDGDKWLEASQLEYMALVRNDTFKLVPKSSVPHGKSIVKSRFVYKIKYAQDGTISLYKARFCAKGYSQIEGVDFGETFAPVVKFASARVLLALAAQEGWHLQQIMDVDNAFLIAPLDEIVYVEQPEGFEEYTEDGELMVRKKCVF